MISNTFRSWLVAQTALATILAAGSACAADEKATGVLEEVVVTAQKREERLQDVPLAVTAVSGSQLAQQHITNTADLARAIPELAYQEGGSPITDTFRVRGIGTVLNTQATEPSVAIVVDGVPYANTSQSFTDFVDLDRVELLRGPQGTLFGKNATAGLINVVTAAPTKTLTGSGTATIAEHDEYRVSGTVSSPITDTLGGRLSAYYKDVGGYLDNITTHKKEGGSKGYGIRGKLAWNPIDKLNVVGAISYSHDNELCCTTVLVAIGTPALAQLMAPIVASPQNRTVKDDMPWMYQSHATTASLQADYETPIGTLTAISGYQDSFVSTNVDIDHLGSPVPIFTTPGGFSQFDLNGGTNKVHNFSQELRIASPADKPLSYVAGAFYNNENLYRYFFRRAATCATGTFGLPCSATFLSVFHHSHLTSTTIAAFAQAEWKVTDQLKLIGGGRVQRDKISVFGVRTADTLVPGDTLYPGLPPSIGTTSGSHTGFSARAAVQYEFSRNAQTYASYSRGYKGESIDTELGANFPAQTFVKPETVDAYEVGFKGRSPDGRATMALALFYSNYQNLQVQANRTDPVTKIIAFQTTNAGSATTKGVELEGTWRPVDELTLSASGAYDDVKVSVAGLSCPIQNQNGAPTLLNNIPDNTCFKQGALVNGVLTAVSGFQQNVKGGVLPEAAKWKFSLSGRWDHPIGETLAIFTTADVQYQSKIGFAIEQDPLLTQKGYAIVNAAIGVHDQANRYSAEIFVRNLFDQNYFIRNTHNFLLGTAVESHNLAASIPRDADRYFGAQVGVKF